ncbi:integrase-like protein [Micromonospora sp. Llam0]|nr:integrase-like protein [Micromonospora sp. Llam0]
MRWHRDLIARRSRPRQAGRPRTVRSIRRLVLRLASNTSKEDAGCQVKYMIRDRDGKFPVLFDTVFADAGIDMVLSGVRVPGMNAVTERWVRTCRRELLGRTLILNQLHLRHALCEYEVFYNEHRPHQGIANVRPLAPLPEPITDPNCLARLKSTDVTASAASSTSTNMLPELPG